MEESDHPTQPPWKMVTTSAAFVVAVRYTTGLPWIEAIVLGILSMFAVIGVVTIVVLAYLVAVGMTRTRGPSEIVLYGVIAVLYAISWRNKYNNLQDYRDREMNATRLAELLYN